uniref:Urotensin 2B n=1 Tax=Bos mutus grunniens TaxID=30521 RepID=A0A8B9W1I7_BOSMU
MNVILSTTLSFGLLTLLSVMIFLESVHGVPYFVQDKEDADGEEPLLALLNKNFGFQRPSNIDIELADKLEELNQLEKLKEQLMEAKDAEMSYAIDGLSSSHPNKREPAESLSRGEPNPEKLLFFFVSITSFSRDTSSSRSKSFAARSVADFASLTVGDD